MEYKPSKDEVMRDMIEYEIDNSIALAIIRQEMEVQANFGNAYLELYLKDLARQIEYGIESKILN